MPVSALHMFCCNLICLKLLCHGFLRQINIFVICPSQEKEIVVIFRGAWPTGHYVKRVIHVFHDSSMSGCYVDC
jgi:hypothetical protein